MIGAMAERIDKSEQLQFDYESLDADTRLFVYERAQFIHRLARMTATSIVQIGKYLVEVKDRIGHGRFRDWVNKEFGWSRQSAVAFMQVYEHFKCQNFGHLKIDISALYLIAAPGTPDSVRDEVIRRAEKGEKITRSIVKSVLKESMGRGDVQEAEAEKELPSPARAREIAIQTGMHTLDSNGVYQPPMTVEDQRRWREETGRISAVLNLAQWPEVQHDPMEILELIEKYKWQSQVRSVSLRQLIGWLTAFEEERRKRYEKHPKTKSGQ